MGQGEVACIERQWDDWHHVRGKGQAPWTEQVAGWGVGG